MLLHVSLSTPTPNIMTYFKNYKLLYVAKYAARNATSLEV